MVKKYLCLLVMYIITITAFGQTINSINIGDTLPLVKIEKYYNFPEANISLSDYKGKLIILDFWNKWCGTCIASFPKMEDLQNKFGDKIKIILVTNDTKEDVQKTFKKVKIPSLPIITGDSILTKMFPHMTVPHHVWINQFGVVQFITDGENATEVNIEKVLQRMPISLYLRKEVGDFNMNVPLWEEGNGRLQKYITSYSYATKRIEENSASLYGMEKDTLNKTTKFKFFNGSLLELFKLVFGKSIYKTEYKNNNRVIFDLPGKGERFLIPKSPDSLQAWANKNLVCYEAKWQVNNDSLIYHYLQEDVNKFFQYSVKTEYKNVNSYVITIADNKKLQKGSLEKKQIYWKNDSIIFRNAPISDLVINLNGVNLFDSIPLIDQTGLNENINLSLINALTNMTTLKKEFIKNGLLLEQKVSSIKMLVIREKK